MLIKHAKRLLKIFIAVMSAVIVLLFFISFIGACKHNTCDNIIPLDKSWSVYYSDSVISAVGKVSDFRVPSDIKPGDTIIYEHRVGGKPIPRPSTLRFKAYHVAVAVYVDTACYYRYGFDRYERGEMVGSGYHLVNMPEHLEGHKIRIQTIVTEFAAAQSLTSIELLRSPGMTDYFVRNNESITIGIFLMFFGLIGFITGCVAVGFDRAFYRLILIGVFSFFMGFWTLEYACGIQIFSNNFALNTTLEYVSLYFCAIPFGLLIINMRHGKIALWKMNVLKIIVGFGIAFFVVSTALHVTNTIHYPSTLVIFHLYIFVSFLFMAFGKVLYNHGVGMQEKILASGSIVFMLFAVVDLFRYNIQNIFGLQQPLFDTTLLPIGALLFILLLMVGYLVYLYDEMRDKAEKDMLRQLAYRDALTGLYNRAKCELIFEILDRTDNDYAIVSIDVNGLKYVNDHYGHSMGDKLLCGFADIFKNAFEGVGTTIRMGGDEYVAIVRAEHLEDLESALETMVLLEKEVKLPVKLQVAYGYTVHHTGDAFTAMDVYRMADANMYAMKVASKQGRVD